ncbi:MAG: TfoX/Sxy family protein [Porticoccaceae bacterium]
MSKSKADKEFVAHVIDLMQIIGPVESRRMFSGTGIFLGGLMFGLVDKNTLYLKADDDCVEDFLSMGLEAFTYVKQGKQCQLSYYQAPEEALEHQDDMLVWANKAYACALRAAARRSADSI